MDPFRPLPPAPPSAPPPPPPPLRVEEPPLTLATLVRRPWFLISAASFVIVLLLGYSINRIMLALLHSRAEVVVPNVEGQSLLEALSTVSGLDLSLQQESVEFDESLPAGTIVRQHPPSGMQARAGRAIRVVVSKGGQVFFVPNVVGRPLVEAQSVLAQDGLQMGAVSQMYSTEYQKGVVVDQNPSSGTVVTRGALIDVRVSQGLPPAGAPLLPDFSGQTLDVVRSWAAGVRAEIHVKENPKAAGAAGTVVKQSPAPGQPLLEGEKVKITVVPLLSSGKGSRLTYLVPRGEDEVTVRIVARDNRGESEVYEGRHEGGEKVEVPIGVNSTTRIRIYVNDVLKEEKVLEP